MKTKVIPIRKNPKFILVTIHGGKYFHYWVNEFIKNKYTDIGCFRIKYKSQKLDE